LTTLRFVISIVYLHFPATLTKAPESYRAMNGRRTVATLLVILALSFLNLVPTAAAQSTGSWTALQNLPYIPVHVTVLPNGKVLMYSYYADSLQPWIWDPASNTSTFTVPAPYELFCSGHTEMADGRVFITGGHIADYTGYAHAQIFDPEQNTFTAVPDMNAGRWYPTNTVLPNGDILVVSGDMTSNVSPDPLPQVYQVSTNSWRNLTNAQLQMPLYPIMAVGPDGRVFNAGPSRQTRFLNTAGTGTWTLGPLMNFTGTRDYGPGLFYEAGQMLEVGGSDPPTATAETINLNAATPAFMSTGSMHYARRQHNAVVLPDGTVFIVGGSNGSGFDNSATPVAPTELWNPTTGTWTVMPSIAVYRGYHSTAFLLPDGRVFSGGGNVGGPNFQLYSPPYLSAGARPTISSAPTAAGYAQTIIIGTPDAATISKVSLIHLPAVTHTFDESQRFMSLPFTQANSGLAVTFPANANIAPPGYYMLFLVNSSGVPSVASILQVAAGVAPTTGTVTGSVTNTSNAPLAGVTISGGGASTKSSSDGTYTLNEVTPGSITVTASLAGYQGATTSVAVTADNSASASAMQLAPTNPGNVTGKVVSGTGSVISGATVTAAGLTTTTNTTGVYTLSNVPAGAVTLAASATNYTSATASVTIQAASTLTAPTLTLDTTIGAVTGTLKDSNGVLISNADSPNVGYGGGPTNPVVNGTYTITGVPAGTIQLVATANNYTSQTLNVVVTGGSTATANFVLPAEPPTGSVTGQVTNISTGTGIASATVSWSGGSTTTNASGVFTFSSVNYGTQTFSATATGYEPRSLAVTITGGVANSVDLPLATGGEINAVVQQSSGADLSGATVTITGGAVTTTVTGATSASGVFFSNWIPIGTYTVTASKSGYTTQTATVTVATGATTSVTITLPTAPTTPGNVTGEVVNNLGTGISGVTVSAAGVSTTTTSVGKYTLSNLPVGAAIITASAATYATASTGVTVQSGATVSAPNITLLSDIGSITGTVTNSSGGAALSGATVSWSGGSTTTNSAGTYTLSNVTAGTVQLAVSASGFASQTQSVSVTGGATATENFALSVPPAPATVTGTVTNSSGGAALSGATVGWSGGSTTTSSTGAYTLSNVTAGTVQFVVSASGFTSQTQSIVIAAGATATENFALTAVPATGTITGQVTNISNGLELSGATVSWSGGSTTTNSAGTYTLTNVTSGAQTITAAATGYEPRSLTATVTGGATATLNMPLATGGKINAVVEASGADISGATVTVSGGLVSTTDSGTTSSTGVYLSPWLPIGTYTVTVSKSGYTTQSQSVTVATGATATVTFSTF
jgi:hypothetical protein